MRSLLLLCALSLLPTHARADAPLPLIEGFLGNVLSGSIQQARRGIAIGPHVGAAAVVDDDGNSDFGVTFGLALYTFKRPSLLDLKQRATEMIERRVKARLAEAVAAGAPPPDVKAVVEEEGNKDLDELAGELRGLKEIRPTVLEKPSLKLVVEGGVLGDAWLVRLGAGKGIGPVSLGLGGGMMRGGGDTAPLLGGELSLHLTPIGKLRTPVLDLYVRGEVGFFDAGKAGVFTGGVRALADLL